MKLKQTKRLELELTRSDVEEILLEYFRKKQIELDDVFFKIDTEYDDMFGDMYGPDYVFGGAVVSYTKESETKII